MLGVVWEIENSTGRIILWAVYGVSWTVILLASLVIDHFDLFGLRQVFLYTQGKPYTPVKFKESLF